jgi:hypothetical protein
MLAFLFWIVAGPVLVILVCMGWLWLLNWLIQRMVGCVN